MRPKYTWKLKRRSLKLGERTLIMGVVNVTPDSFSDGGQHFESQKAVEHGLRLLDEGADILDIGGESTRPGAKVGKEGLPEQEELRRILPVIEGVKRARPEAVISVDTYKASVARAAVAAGAQIVNDVSGGHWDNAMFAAIAETGCGAILMHMRGTPETWRSLPAIEGDALVKLVNDELQKTAQAAMAAGVSRESVVLDPGFGFGKRFDENYPLLARLGELGKLGFPILAGTSRKSFIGRTLAKDGKDAPPNERLAGSLAAMAAAILEGAHIVRVHDVKASVEAAKIADAIQLQV